MFASLLGLTGRSPIAGEQMYRLSEERVDLLRRIIPAVPVRTVDLFGHRGWPPIWNVAVTTDAGRWNVVGLFNPTDEARTETVEFEDLHVGDGIQQFAVYDVWENRLLRIVTDRFQLRVPAAGCRVVTVTRILQDQPTILGSNRHITGGAPDIHRVSWNPADLTLSGTSGMVALEPYVLRVCLPEGERGLEIDRADSSAGRILVRAQDRLRYLTFETSATGLVDWKIRFYRVDQPSVMNPAQPRRLTTRQNTRGVHLEWSADDESAVAYRVYRNGRLVAEPETCEYQDSTAAYNASFQYTVTAVDARGNESVPSDSVVHQTPLPASTNLTQLVPLSVSHDRLPLGQDRSVTGGPLRLAGQRIYRGLGMAAPSRAVYFLGGGYDLFTGVVGVDDAAGARGSVVFTIIADAQNLFTSPVMHAGETPQPFSVKVKGKTQMELIVGDAEDGSDADYAAWGNPYLRALPAE